MIFTDVTAAQLVKTMNEISNSLIIDCRSFLVYNKGHISGANNVRCNSIMRRRSKGLFALENAITNSEKRKDFTSGKYAAVVVYDEQGGKVETNDTAPLKCKRTLTMVLDVLEQNAPDSTQIAYLNCSYKEFACKYPKKCQGCTRTSLPVLPLNETIGSANPGSVTPGTAFTPVYDQGAAVEILPHLYLGSGFHASQKEQLQSVGITAILNASSSCPNYFEDDFRYKRIPVEDNCQADISCWFSEAISFINEIKQTNGKVLVHCHAGISRSATICIAYLITCHNISLSEAFRFVKHRRSVISPNFNFMGQLLKLETDVNARKSAAKQEKLSRFDFNIEQKRIEETDCQIENELVLAKNARSRHSLLPLKPLENQLKRDFTSVCQTAPPRTKEFNFFVEPNYSCGQQQNSLLNGHVRRHSRTLTLST